LCDTPSLLAERLPAFGRWQIERQRSLCRTRYDHLHRLAQADVLLDVDHVRWHPHEVASVCFLRLFERVAAIEAGVATDDEDAALGLAMVMHRRGAAGRQLHVPEPDLFGTYRPLRDAGFAQH